VCGEFCCLPGASCTNGGSDCGCPAGMQACNGANSCCRTNSPTGGGAGASSGGSSGNCGSGHHYEAACGKCCLDPWVCCSSFGGPRDCNPSAFCD
jgi:hypothetical protein